MPEHGHFFMDVFDVTRISIALVAVLIIALIFFNRVVFKKNKLTTQFLTRTAIFAALSILLYTIPFLKFSVPFFPAFLELHFDEVPALIASFAYGPLSGAVIIIIKTIVKLPMSTSLCVGELADLIYGLCLVIPAGLIYKKKKNVKGAAIALGASTLLQVTAASFFTTFVILAFYMNVMGLSEETILAMCQAINPGVTSLSWPFLYIVALPFNLFKDVIVIVITLMLYKRLHLLIDRLSAQKN